MKTMSRFVARIVLAALLLSCVGCELINGGPSDPPPQHVTCAYPGSPSKQLEAGTPIFDLEVHVIVIGVVDKDSVAQEIPENLPEKGWLRIRCGSVEGSIR